MKLRTVHSRPNPPLLVYFLLLTPDINPGAPTFCKCTCFTNSTIIPLGPGHDPPAPLPSESDATTSSSSSSSSPSGDSSSSSFLTSSSTKAATTDEPTSPPLATRAASSSCAQCNRAFCLRYNLPICKGAQEKDVTTMCFQRDSRKDQILVWGFILGTTGLLGWAGARRVLDRKGSSPPVATAVGGRGAAGRMGFAGYQRPAAGGGGGGGGGGSAALGSFGWFNFLRRRGSGGNGGGLRARDDAAARGAYSPIQGAENARGHGLG